MSKLAFHTFQKRGILLAAFASLFSKHYFFILLFVAVLIHCMIYYQHGSLNHYRKQKSKKKSTKNFKLYRYKNRTYFLLLRPLWLQSEEAVRATEIPEHPVAQGRPQGGGSKVADVSPVKTLLSQSNADHQLLKVYV